MAALNLQFLEMSLFIWFDLPDILRGKCNRLSIILTLNSLRNELAMTVKPRWGKLFASMAPTWEISGNRQIWDYKQQVKKPPETGGFSAWDT
ncbi:hypothetical protein EBAPG3_004940 [Nitrosospira lacus]|uniref:Uncharacterized protein n=1 Tax=Nitrosospira lacus TaxID=1288494 RepID=A0A1W6SN05_9PROT|nr:hypothetical protein [Nitrosospira lacus]ARO87166.1 hypothetical protein EBAPG3_004940 [Nitrosospira lacus]